MRRGIFVTLVITQSVFATEKQDKTHSPPVTRPAVTVKDAKQACKSEGKEGDQLLKCIKEKMGVQTH